MFEWLLRWFKKDKNVPVGEEFDAYFPMERSKGGSTIWRHEARGDPYENLGKTQFLDEDEMDAITGHIEKCIGPVENVMHEIISDQVHIDILIVEPDKTAGRDFVFLCSMGMSAIGMQVPDPEIPAHAEIAMLLPADWPVNMESLQAIGDDVGWPFQWLKVLARMPSEYDTYLGPGHTIPTGDPAEPLSPATAFIGFAIFPGSVVSKSFESMKAGGKKVAFLVAIPLFEEEMNYKLDEGFEALDRRFVESKLPLSKWANPTRTNLCA